MEDTKPKIYSAQAAGCNPVVTAIKKGSDIIEPQKPNTIAKSIAIGNPADGYYAVKAIRESGGGGASVSDEEIVAGMRLLAETEGVFTETAGGVTVAGARRLIDSGAIGRGDSLVLAITGQGLKTTDPLVGDTPAPPVIQPKLSELTALVNS